MFKIKQGGNFIKRRVAENFLGTQVNGTSRGKRKHLSDGIGNESTRAPTPVSRLDTNMFYKLQRVGNNYYVMFVSFLFWN